MTSRNIKLLAVACLLASVAFVGLVTLHKPLPARAAALPFLFKWGESGAGPGQFNNPGGVAVSGTTVYVADSYNQRIQKFAVYSASGGISATFVISWGSTGITGTSPARFNAPSALAIDGFGNVYVADTNNHRIQKFDGNGGYITSWGSSGSGPGQLSSPGGVVVSGTSLYVADSKNNRVQVFSLSGTPVFSWGVAGVGQGEFNNPVGIAVDGQGFVYVADSDNNRVQKFDGSGQFVLAWGMTGTLSGQFVRPTGMAVDVTTGSVYVVDSGNNRIQVFDSQGNLTAAWGEFGGGDGQFMLVSGIAVDGNGVAYVADTGNNRIQAFGAPVIAPSTPIALAYIATKGVSGTRAGEFRAPTDIALDDGGNVYVADTGNKRVQKFDSNLNFVLELTRTAKDAFLSVAGVAVSGTRVYVADASGGQVHIFNNSGVYESDWSIVYPVAIALDKAGYAYVANGRSNLIHKLDSAGQQVGQWGGYGYGDGVFTLIGDVAVNTAGEVYVSDYAYMTYMSSRVQKFTADGGFVARFGGYGADPGHLNAPAGLAIDKGGNIYVADSGNRRMQQFSADHNYLASIEIKTFGDHGAFTNPRGVAVSADGRYVYVVDTGGNRIVKFGASLAPANYLFSFGEYGSGAGQFNKPGGIATDDAPVNSLAAVNTRAPAATSYIYVADTLNSRIQKFTSQGVFVLEWSWWPIYDPISNQFIMPGGVAYSAYNNRVYVADTFVDRIVYFDPLGNYKGQWGTTGAHTLDHPVGVAVDKYGYVYVTDTGKDRVMKFTSTGGYLSTFGPTIAGLSNPSYLKRPSGIAVDSQGFIYISDTGNHRVVKLTAAGAFVRKWGSYGVGVTQFNGPVGITVGNGYATIADTGNSRLMKYTSGGVFVAQVGTRGSAPGQFNNVTGVAYDGKGNLLATDTQNHTVVIYEGVYLDWLPIVRRK
jgi:DNA-binding beta-propeller fold protein YncE